MTEVAKILADLKEAETEMSDGDYNFYSSLKNQYDTKAKLSASQIFHLERVAKKYDPIKLSEDRQFRANYSDYQRNAACQVALYYDAQFPRYFGNIIDIVLDDPKGHTLTKGQWHAICENKYAKKIRTAYEAKDKFAEGDFVQIRTNNRVDLANVSREGRSLPAYLRARANGKIKDKYALVLKSGAKPITRAAKGSKIYQILLTDESQTIFAHESDLKKARRPKK